MKQEADRLIFSRVSVEAGREEGGGVQVSWGGVVRVREYILLMRTPARSSMPEHTEKRRGEINHTSPEHAFSLTLLSWKATVYLLIASTWMVKTKQK